MTNPDHPKQPTTPEQGRIHEQQQKNDTGDLALLAEFYSEQFAQRAKSTPEGVTKKRIQNDATEMTGAARRIADLAQHDYTTIEEAIVAFAELEQGFLDEFDDKTTEPSEAYQRELDQGLAEIRRARDFLEQNRDTDFYARKDFSEWLKVRNQRVREARQAEDRKREEEAVVKTTRQIDEIRENLGIAELPPRETGIKTLLTQLKTEEQRDIEKASKDQANVGAVYEPYLSALRTAFESEKEFLTFVDQLMIKIFDEEKKQRSVVLNEMSTVDKVDAGVRLDREVTAKARQRALIRAYRELPEHVKSALEQGRTQEDERQETLVKQWKGGAKFVPAPNQLLDRLYAIFRKKDLL